ncbi:VCBS repeat-containing protein [Fulvivirgaceae bacterium BMA12]|uniref:VCBS repeat-containing protein n=1 Tax=Agaribacillus aureus TaxID=3051825 RepID=A0ABT8L629_9BACT|nr:VCBS repeat-containing protein [Fulvivirgaceae bacterium BMA12]
MKNLILTLCVSLSWTALYAQQWHYIEIESNKQKWGDWNEPNWLRYFGLDAGDVDHDGDLDILSGRYVYHNPGGSMDGPWKRTVLDDNVDGIFIMDVDNDPYTDLIAQALPNIYWYEAVDTEGTRYVRKKVTEVPATSHINSQGFEKVQLIPGGKEELLIAGNGNVYLIRIPENPGSGEKWPTYLVGRNTSDEGIGVGDLDGDGDLDIACGRRKEGEDEPRQLVWFENSGSVETSWSSYLIGETEHPIDRIKIADLNDNHQNEVVITEERYPGHEPDGYVYWFSNNGDAKGTWAKSVLTQQYSTNNLDIKDLDNDGDLDLVTAEHKGPSLELQLWENLGNASFEKKVISNGKENHLGAKCFDLDNDGDLDIIGAAWDAYQYMHLWRNESSSRRTVNEVALKSKTLRDTLVTQYQGRNHFVIKTKHITYYYDILGGGFSRLIDVDGNDWVSFKTSSGQSYPQGAAGMFRGVPNLVYHGDSNGAGHPGFDQCNSWFENGKLYSESKNKKWKWVWTFSDDHAELEILVADLTSNYWFLYEGIPGGRFSPDQYYYGFDDKGPQSQIHDFYNGESLFTRLNWAYAGVKNNDKVFYMLHKNGTKQPGIISYLGNSTNGIQSKDGMTVFGFGRGPDTNALLSGKNTFIIGLYPKKIDSPEAHDAFEIYLKNTFE